MQVETKYDIGDKTWVLVQTDQQILKRCSECDAVLVNKMQYEVREVTVESISYVEMAGFKEKEHDRTSYHFTEEEDGYHGQEYIIRNESETYETKALALAAAKTKNSEDSK